ncbi:hypothetical protein D0T23_05140 [Duganella sp. BJB475]|nr:hypothetical protein D0T23_05140 [Duganella sp. BJB475]
MFSAGGFAHMPNEKDLQSGEFASTRTDALRRACASILRRIGGDQVGGGAKEVAAVRAWVEGLCA